MDRYNYESDSDEEYSDAQLEFQKQTEKYLILDQINNLYENVFSSFRNGEQIVFNPAMFTKMTRQMFTDWVIRNNLKLEEMFYPD